MTLEEYRKMIDDAVADIEFGNVITHEELLESVKVW